MVEEYELILQVCLEETLGCVDGHVFFLKACSCLIIHILFQFYQNWGINPMIFWMKSYFFVNILDKLKIYLFKNDFKTVHLSFTNLYTVIEIE